MSRGLEDKHTVRARHQHITPSMEQGKPAPGLGTGAGTLPAETQALGTAPWHHPPLMGKYTGLDTATSEPCAKKHYSPVHWQPCFIEFRSSNTSIPAEPLDSDGGISLHLRASTEAKVMALLLLRHPTCSGPTDHTGAARCTAALVSPNGWVDFQMNFH